MATKPAKKGKVEKKVAAKKAPVAKKVAAKPAKVKAVKKVAAAKAPAKKAAPAKVVKASEAVAKVHQIAKPKNTNGSFTQSEFLDNLRSYCGLEKRSQAKELVGDVQKLIQDSLVKGYKIPFFGLGKLYVRQTKERMGRNPQTGAATKIPARKRVRFTPAKALKEAIAKK
jgi:DNA-binding protein HU-beta